MRFGVALLRFIHPKPEQERMEWRHEMARVRAHAEDLTRTIVGLDPNELRKAGDACREKGFL